MAAIQQYLIWKGIKNTIGCLCVCVFLVSLLLALWNAKSSYPAVLLHAASTHISLRWTLWTNHNKTPKCIWNTGNFQQSIQHTMWEHDIDKFIKLSTWYVCIMHSVHRIVESALPLVILRNTALPNKCFQFVLHRPPFPLPFSAITWI